MRRLATVLGFVLAGLVLAQSTGLVPIEPENGHEATVEAPGKKDPISELLHWALD